MLLSVVAACSVGSVHAAEELVVPPSESVSNSTSVIGILIDDKLIHQKPAVFESWGHRLDYIHTNLTYGLDRRTRELDLFFSDKELPNIQQEKNSRFRLGIYTSLRKEEDFELKFAPEFKADVELPNLEARWSVFIDTRGNDELPGVDPTERESGAQIGVTKKGFRSRLKWKTGVKARVPPEAFTKLEWRENFEGLGWNFIPYANAYVDTADGFGQLTSFSAYNWVGKSQRWYLKSVTAGIWGDDFDGYELEQTVGFGYVPLVLEDRKVGKNISRDDTGRAYGVRYSLFGTVDDTSYIRRHRLTLMYRWPLYKGWLYGDLSPEVEWRDEDDWEVISTLKIGVDALFWGHN